MTPPNALAVFSLTFAYLCLGLFYLVLYFKSRRRELDHLVFSALTVALAGYSYGCYRLYISESPIEGRFWQVAQTAFAIPAAPLLLHFFWLYLKIPGIRRLRIAYGAAALFLVLDLWTPLFFSHDPLIKRFVLGGMPVTYHEVENGSAAFAFYLSVVFYLGLIFVWIFRAPVEIRHRLGPVRWGFGIICLTILNDMAVSGGVYESVYLLEYGYFAFAIGMAAVLLNRYADLSNDLEHAVQERTRELNRLGEALAQSERLAATGMLAATLSHEVRNPLAIILSSLDIIGDEVETEEGREVLLSARAEVRRISTIARDLLGLARPRPGPEEPLDVNAVVKDFLKFYGHRLAAARIGIETVLDKGCQKVEGRQGPLQQVLLNLIQNSEDAMADGGRIWIRTVRQPAGGACIEVEDTGPGVDPEHVSRIFEAFFSTKGEMGNGLGLFIAQGIVESMGGRIVAESPPGKGAIFRVYLPPRGRDSRSTGGRPGLD